jgi:hypothetical protein
MDNIKEVMVKDNFANEVRVIDITSTHGKNVATRYDIPEVPCLIIGGNYYFRDDILFKENLSVVFKKNG